MSEQSERKPDILKAGAVIIKDRKFLVTRAKGKDVFVAPGGKLDPGETPVDAVKRELSEELTIDVHEQKLGKLGVYYAQAAGHAEPALLEMTVFIVPEYDGEIKPAAEIDEVRWIDSSDAGRDDLPLGSIFEHDVLPALKDQDLID